MNMTAFWLTWLLLSIAMQAYSNQRMNKRVNKMHELNKQIKHQLVRASLM